MPAWKQVRGLEALQPPQPQGDPIAEWTLRVLGDQPGHALTLGPHTIYVTDEATRLFKEEFIHEGLIPEPPPKDDITIRQLLDAYARVHEAPNKQPAITRLGGAHIARAADDTVTIRPLPSLSALATLCQGPEALETALATNPNCTPEDRCPTSIAGIHRLHNPNAPQLIEGLDKIDRAIRQGLQAYDDLAREAAEMDEFPRFLGILDNKTPYIYLNELMKIINKKIKVRSYYVRPYIPDPRHIYVILKPTDSQIRSSETVPYPSSSIQPLHQATQSNPDPEALVLYALLIIKGTLRDLQLITFPTSPPLTVDYKHAAIQHAINITLQVADQEITLPYKTENYELNGYAIKITGVTPTIKLADTIQRILEAVQILSKSKSTCQPITISRALAVTRETRIYTMANMLVTTKGLSLPSTWGYLTDSIHSLLKI